MDAPKFLRSHTSFIASDSITDFKLSESLNNLNADDDVGEKELECDDTDIKCLKNNILFKYMNTEKLHTLIREKTIVLKRKKCQDIIARGVECQDNIYIVKSGTIGVLVKLTRDNMRVHGEKIDKFHIKNESDYSQLSKQKARYRRTALIDLIASKNSLNSDRPSYINCSSAFDLSTSSRYTSCSSISSSTINLPNPSHRSSVVTSRATTARSTTARILTAKKQGPETTRPVNQMSASQGVLSHARPVTVRVNKKRGEEAGVPFRGTLSRFAGVRKQNSEDVSQYSMNSEDLFEEKFESNLKLLTRVNSAKTDTLTEKSMKTITDDHCTELSEETLNDFEDLPLPTKDASDSQSQILLSRPKTGHPGINKKHPRISEDDCHASYVKLMQLNSNEMFGLSELIFNNNKNIYKENFTIENFRMKSFNMSEFESDQSLNSRNMNSYVMICRSREVEFYVVKKSLFLNNMNDTEKFFFQSQIENIQKNCPQIPTNEVIAGNFAEKQKWNNYKKKVYNDALKSRSSCKFITNENSRTKSTYVISNDRQQYTASSSNYSPYSTSDLIRNARMNVKNSNSSLLSQKFTFSLSKEIVAQKRNAGHEVHSGKSRFRF